VKYIFIIFFSFCSLFFNNGLKAAEKINIKFEEMEIPFTIEQLSKLEKYKDDSTELIDWLKKNGLKRVFELSKFLEFPIFKAVGLNREILRSWIGRKILTELSKTIKVPNDNDGVEIYNTIENLFDEKKEISTLEIIKPGISCSEIYSKLSQSLITNNVSIGRMGHGLGLQLTEPPSIMENDETLLEENMIITLEPSIEMDENKILVQEENLLITKDSYKLLSTRTPENLPIIN